MIDQRKVLYTFFFKTIYLTRDFDNNLYVIKLHMLMLNTQCYSTQHFNNNEGDWTLNLYILFHSFVLNISF